MAADSVPTAIQPNDSVDSTRNRSWIGVTWTNDRTP